MALSRHSRQHYFPISPRLEHRIEARASRKSRIAEMAESQKQAAALVRGQARLRRQREHHLERVRDLERRIEEGETARRAINSQQSQVPGSLHRLAQDQVDFEVQDRTERVAPEDHFERTRNAPGDVRHQLKNAFHIEHEAVARFDRPRRIARLKGAELHISRLSSRHNHRYEVIDSECAACLQSIER
jgi:seryl-tRNA synthetase